MDHFFAAAVRRYEDFHPARFATLSAAPRPDDLLTILKDGFVDRFRKFGFSPLRYPSYKVLTFTLVGLPPTEHTSFS